MHLAQAQLERTASDGSAGLERTESLLSNTPSAETGHHDRPSTSANAVQMPWPRPQPASALELHRMHAAQNVYATAMRQELMRRELQMRQAAATNAMRHAPQPLTAAPAPVAPIHPLVSGLSTNGPDW